MAEYVHFEKMPLPFASGKFDIIFTACVFHHIPHSEFPLIFQEIDRILAPNGIAIIFEHNPYNPLTQKAVQSCPFDENAVLITAKELCSHIRLAGLLPKKTVYRVYFPAFLRICRPIEKYLGWLPLGAQYYILAQKVERV